MADTVATFFQRTKAAHKIVVVDLGFLGDTLHLLPALAEIKDHYPAAQLHVVSTPLGAEILAMCPVVDKTWIFPLGPPSPHWHEHWDILLALRREQFDVAINFSGADRTVIITALTGARWRLAQQGNRHHFWQSLLIANWVPRQSVSEPVYEQRRHVLTCAGFNLREVRYEFVVPKEQLDWAAAHIPKGSIHFSINASTPLKEWPLDNWIDLARLWINAHPGACLVATGSSSPREQERLNQLKSALRSPNLILLPPGLPIPQLAALLSQCILHVGADSGVLHLAVALGISTVSVFRQYSGLLEWAPRGAQHKYVTAPCECANKHMAPCQSIGYADCLSRIPATRIAALMEELCGQK